ncbi:MAG: hypothetical protein ACRD9R_18900 [Pyrinomonadaceae bacterium]
MLKKLHIICAWLLSALGLVHIGFTPFAYREFNLNALWFAGAGVALVFAGFLNFAAVRHAAVDRVVRALCLAANFLVFALFAAAFTLLREPQVYVGLALSACASAATLMRGQTK